jgi:hypothetical protein
VAAVTGALPGIKTGAETGAETVVNLHDLPDGGWGALLPAHLEASGIAAIDSPVFAVHRLRERLELAAIAAGCLHPEQLAALQLQEAGL